MYAKSIIEYVRGRLIAGAWTKKLSFVPVVMALAVAALPFTLGARLGSPEVAATPDVAETTVESPGSLVKTAAAIRLGASEERRYALVADYMARKYLVSRHVVLDFVHTAHIAGRRYNVDPLLLVAVIAVESSFNPIAESVAGAKGLMQIIPHFHLEKFTEFGGEQAVFEPRTNIAVGARIIREYLQSSSGDLFTALQTYAGALPDRDAAYTHKVLNEKDRLDALMGLPKTDRSSRALPASAVVTPAPAVEHAPKGRVQTNIPARPATPEPAVETKPSDAPRAAPALPLTSSPLAALRLP